MTDKPSKWALDVWEQAREDAYQAYAAGEGTAKCDAAAALIIEQARTQWEMEICEWLRGDGERFIDTDRGCLEHAIEAIERGEYREGK